jgi:hypothetical protein
LPHYDGDPGAFPPAQGRSGVILEDDASSSSGLTTRMVVAETFLAMTTWTATAVALAHPAAVLDVLTDPDACARWAPVPFDVEVRQADEHGLQLSATGPVALDVDYRLAPTTHGSQVHASVSVRPRRGLLGRLLAEATGALLSAGALDRALARLATEAATA